MLVEVIFYDRVGSYRNGQIAEIPDGPFLRALLKGKKADVLNPPDWSPDSAVINQTVVEEVPVESVVEEVPVEPVVEEVPVEPVVEEVPVEPVESIVESVESIVESVESIVESVEPVESAVKTPKKSRKIYFGDESTDEFTEI